MSRKQKIISTNELRSNLSQIMDEVFYENTDMIVTRFDKVKCKLSKATEVLEELKSKELQKNT